MLKNSFFTCLTLFRSGGYQIDTCLPFSLYLLHGFRSESEQPDRNRVNTEALKKKRITFSLSPDVTDLDSQKLCQ